MREETDHDHHQDNQSADDLADVGADDAWCDRGVWLDQQEASDCVLLGDVAMWTAWRAGWRAQAIRALHELLDRKRD